MNKILLFIILGIVSLIGVRAGAQNPPVQTIKDQIQVPNQRGEAEIRLDIIRFLNRTDSAMLITNADFLRGIDSTYVEPEDMVYYRYLTKVLEAQDTLKEIEGKHQDIEDLETQLKAKKAELAKQITELRTLANTSLIAPFNKGTIKLSAEQNQYLDNLLARIVVYRDLYRTTSSPSNKPKKKGK